MKSSVGVKTTSEWHVSKKSVSGEVMLCVMKTELIAVQNIPPKCGKKPV